MPNQSFPGAKRTVLSGMVVVKYRHNDQYKKQKQKQKKKQISLKYTVSQNPITFN